MSVCMNASVCAEVKAEDSVGPERGQVQEELARKTPCRTGLQLLGSGREQTGYRQEPPDCRDVLGSEIRAPPSSAHLS